jgi:hypothetical protein
MAGETGLDAKSGQIEGVDEAEADTLLAVTDHPLENEVRYEKAQPRHAGQQQRRGEAADEQGRSKTEQSH